MKNQIFIITEAGVNLNGSMEQAIGLIDTVAGNWPITQTLSAQSSFDRSHALRGNDIFNRNN